MMNAATRLFALAALLVCVASPARAYDFTYTYANATLCYNITDASAHTAELTYQQRPNWEQGIHAYAASLPDTLRIPATVLHNGENYRVTKIGEMALCNISSVSVVIIPEGVVCLGDNGLSDCGALHAISLPQTLRTIGKYCFSSNNNLSAVVLPQNVATIGDGAFSGCHGLTTVVLPDSLEKISEQMFYCCPLTTAFSMPLGVKSIEGSAFAYTGLTSIDIPQGVRKIYGSAFESTPLTSIELPSSVCWLGAAVFAKCNNLANINVAENNAHYCSVDGVLFNKSRDTLWLYPCGRTSPHYDVPEGVVALHNYAFFACTRLASVSLPASLRSIGCLTFSDCSFTQFDISAGVRFVASRAFMDCHQLSSISFGSGVQRIDAYALAYCDHLTQVTCKAITPPVLEDHIIYDVDNTIPVYVPCQSIQQYEATQYWNDFVNFQCMEDAIEEPRVQLLEIFPNPARDVITVQRPKMEEDWQVQLCDMQGKVVKQDIMRCGQGRLTLDIAPLPSGIYYIRAKGERDFAGLSIVVQR